MLVAEPEVDTTKAQQQWDEFVNKAGDGLDDLVGKGGKVEAELQAIAKETKKAADAAEKMKDRLSLEDKVGMFGDLKDAFEMTGKSLFGLSDAAAEAALGVADLAEKGMMIGAPFGAIGAVVGGVAGTALGLFNERAKVASAEAAKLAEEAKRTADEIAELTQYNEELAVALQSVGKDSIPELLDHMDDLEGQIAEVNKELLKNGPAFDQWMNRLLLLSAAQNKDAMQAADMIQGQLLGALAAINASTAKPKGLKDLKEELGDLSDPSNNQSIPGLQKQIGDLWTKIDDFGKTTGLSLSGEYTEQWAQQAGVLTTQLNAALTRQTEIKDQIKETTEAQKELTFAELAARAAADQDAAARMGRTAQEAKWQAEADALEEGMALVEAEQFAAEEAARQEEVSRKQTWADADLAFEIQIAKSKQAIQDQAAAEAARKAQAAHDSMINLQVAMFTQVANLVGGAALKGIDAFYDAFANGEKRSKEDRRKALADFARDTGTKLMTDGFGHVVAGGANSIRNPGTGTAEIVAGLKEMGVGAAMGGVGAFAQRGMGGTGDRRGGGSSTPARGDASGVTGSDSGTRDLRPIVINFDSTVPATEREAQEVADKLQGILNTRRR